MVETTATTQAPDYLGHRKRLRERFLLGGGKDMADYELLELALMMVIPRRDVKPLAKELIRKFGSFSEVISAPDYELTAISGVKENVLAMLKLLYVSSVRTSWQTLKATDEPVLNKLDYLIDYCRTSMSFSDIEELHVLFLDGRLRLIKDELMQKGTNNCVAVHPREIIKAALALKAASIIMVHNHPTGNTTPSKNDIENTKNVKAACASVGITLCDHIIIGRNSHYSFSEHYIL